MEEIIELESSDEEQGPPPGKRRRQNHNQPISTNIMVNIPHGVTIKPVGKRKEKKSLKISNVTTVNNIKQSHSQPKRAPNVAAVKRLPTLGPINKLPIIGPAKRPANTGPAKRPANTEPVKNPAQFPQNSAESQVLKKLPPCVTVTKTGLPIASPKRGAIKVTSTKILQMPKVQLKQNTAQIARHIQTTPSKKRQWYKTPEESGPSPEQNNDKQTFIEIVIEDSPVKPKAKQVRKLSSDNVITIDDSPNKALPLNPYNDEGSDEEPTASRKSPNSKKKLEYQDQILTPIVEEKTYEIEIDPIAVELVPNNNPSIGSKAPDLKADTSKEQESSIETTQDKAPVVLNKPTPSKKEKEVCMKDPKDEEFHPIYLQFIHLCLQLENSEDMLKIIDKKIKTYYKQVPKEYTHSEDFIERVSGKMASIKANPKEMYLYIKDIVDDLNIQRKLAKQMPVQEDKSKDTESFTQVNEDLEPNKKKQINKLEKSLKKFNRAIKNLEMQEVDFDDEDGSVYLLTEKYKERIVRIHAKLCQLTNTKMPSEPRLVLEPGPGRAPGPARRLENWINKKKELTFPDFHDVLRCVRQANTEDSLGWSEAIIMEEARDLFCRCGKKLQRRRQEREWRLATSRLTVEADPAEESDELKRRLEDNRRVARTNESEVFNKWSTIQNHQNLEPEEIDDKDAEESPIESEEEDNDENSTLENKQKRKDILKKLLKEQAKKTSTQPATEETDEKVEKTEPRTAPNVDDEHDSGSDEIGSDVDELHLLQKLRSDDVVYGVSSSESSDLESPDLESPIAISDTLESSSDESVISIVLSSDDDAPKDSKTNAKSSDAMDDSVGSNSDNLSPATVVALDSESEKSVETNKLSSKSNYNIAEETVSKPSNDQDDILDDELMILPDAVVALDSEAKKSLEKKKISKEDNDNIAAKNNMGITLNEQDNTLEDELMLLPDSVVALDSEAEKSEKPKKIPTENKDKNVTENNVSKTANERDNNLDDELILSPDVVTLDCEAEKIDQAKKIPKENKDNNIGEIITNRTCKKDIPNNDESIISPDRALNSGSEKSEEAIKLSREIKDNIEEKTTSENSTDRDNSLDDELLLTPETVIGKSEATNKLSRENKDIVTESTSKTFDGQDHNEPILTPDILAALDCETDNSGEVNKLSKDGSKDNIAENTMSKTCNDRDSIFDDELLLSPNTAALDSETEKSEVTNKLSREDNDAAKNGKASKELGSSSNDCSKSEMITDNSKENTESNGECETSTSIQPADPNTGHEEAPKNVVPCVNTGDVIDSNNANDTSVPDLIQSAVDDENVTSNDLHASGSPAPVQPVLRRLDEIVETQ